MNWENVASLWLGLAPDWLGRMFLAFLAGAVAWLIGRAARGWLLRLIERTRVDAHARFLAGQLLYWLVLAIGLLLALALLGIEQSVLLTTFGAAGLALGLAAQDILKSYFAGLYLLFERPFLIGDEIQVKEHVGRVQHVGFRATSILTADNVRVVVPNVIIFSEVISNRTGRSVEAGQTRGSVAGTADAGAGRQAEHPRRRLGRGLRSLGPPRQRRGQDSSDQ